MIPYPDLENLPSNLQALSASRKPLNVFRMVMHAQDFAPAYFGMADATKVCTIAAPHRELIILRVGESYGSNYELFHHRRIARSVGLSEAAITAAGVFEGQQQGLSQRESDIIAWTDMLLSDHALRGEHRDRALRELGMRGVADLVFIVGFYQLVCNFLLTFDIPVEEGMGKQG